MATTWTRCVLAPLACELLAATAHASLTPTYPLGSVAGTWEVDRYTPAVFSNAGTLLGRSNVLDLGLSSAGQPRQPPPGVPVDVLQHAGSIP